MEQLSPGENLMIAIFGEREKEGKFLSEEGEKTVLDVLETVDMRGAAVIRHRFGFIPRNEMEKRQRRDGGDGRTLTEVGVIYGVSGERIRQIEQGILRKLRHPTRSRKLKWYLPEFSERATLVNFG